MIRDTLSLAPWWFWIFVFPELAITAIMIPFMVVAGVVGWVAERRAKV